MTSKARSTHEQSRARNKKFAEIAQSPEVRKILDCIPKSTHVSYLRNLCEEKYGFVIPPSAAYKVMSTLDNRFKPKTRQVKKLYVEITKSHGLCPAPHQRDTCAAELRSSPDEHTDEATGEHSE